MSNSFNIRLKPALKAYKPKYPEIAYFFDGLIDLALAEGIQNNYQKKLNANNFTT